MYGDKGEIPEGEYLIPIGKADIKKKETCYHSFFWENFKSCSRSC